MDIILACVADFASESNGKLNIFGIFDEIRATEFPFTIGHMYFAFRTRVPPEEFSNPPQIRVTFVDPEGNVLMDVLATINIQVTEPNGRPNVSNQVIGAVGPTFPMPGEYAFNIYIAGELAKSVQIFVSDRSESPDAN